MIRRLLCPNLPKVGRLAPLSEEEAHHARQVLRLREGDPIEAIDGKGNSAQCTLRIKQGQMMLELSSPDLTTHPPPLPVRLEMGIIKADAMEWAIEKAVEIGVDQLVPLITDFSIVQVEKKGPEFFQDRWQRIANQALKQCGRLHQMQVNAPSRIADLIGKTAGQGGVRLWCDEKARGEAVESSSFLLDWLITQWAPHRFQPLRILIGPEGGWSAQERNLLMGNNPDQNLRRIHLGQSILRAETAALYAASVITAFMNSSFANKPQAD